MFLSYLFLLHHFSDKERDDETAIETRLNEAVRQSLQNRRDFLAQRQLNIKNPTWNQDINQDGTKRADAVCGMDKKHRTTRREKISKTVPKSPMLTRRDTPKPKPIKKESRQEHQSKFDSFTIEQNDKNSTKYDDNEETKQYTKAVKVLMEEFYRRRKIRNELKIVTDRMKNWKRFINLEELAIPGKGKAFMSIKGDSKASLFRSVITLMY